MIRKKIKLTIFFVPIYFIVLIGEWYETTDNGRKFSYKRFNSAYWKDVKRIMKAKG